LSNFRASGSGVASWRCVRPIDLGKLLITRFMNSFDSLLGIRTDRLASHIDLLSSRCGTVLLNCGSDGGPLEVHRLGSSVIRTLRNHAAIDGAQRVITMAAAIVIIENKVLATMVAVASATYF